MIEERPLRSGEALSIQFLAGFIQHLQDMDVKLNARLKATGLSKKLHMIQTLSSNLFRELMETVPAVKRQNFMDNLDCQEMVIKTRRIEGMEDRGYTYIRGDDLLQLCAFAAEWNCRTCGDTKEEMAHCPFRKVMDRSVMIEMEPNYSNCVWKELDWDEFKKE